MKKLIKEKPGHYDLKVDNIWYDDLSDKLDYRREPYVRIWSSSSGSCTIEKVEDMGGTKVLWDIATESTYIRNSDHDFESGGTMYYCWVSLSDYVFTAGDYDYGDYESVNYLKYDTWDDEYDEIVGDIQIKGYIDKSMYRVSFGIENGKKLRTLGAFSFKNCSGLTKVEVSEGITKLNGAFYGCSDLSEVILPSGLKTISGRINNRPFSQCVSLRSIVIPDTVTSIVSNAFEYCTNLTAIYYNGTATGSPWGASNATVLPNPN